MGLYLVDVFDNITRIAEADDGLLVEAIPFMPRKRPPVIPDRRVPGAKTATVHIADIYNGPGLAGVPRGTAKKLRVFSYHFNYHKTGGHSTPGLDRVESSWDIKRVLGTVEPRSMDKMDDNVAVAMQKMQLWALKVKLLPTGDDSLLGIERKCDGERLLALFNFSEWPKPAQLEGGGSLTDLWTGSPVRVEGLTVPAGSFMWLLDN